MYFFIDFYLRLQVNRLNSFATIPIAIGTKAPSYFIFSFKNISSRKDAFYFWLLVKLHKKSLSKERL